MKKIQELYEENVFVTYGLCPSDCHVMNNMHFHDGFEIYVALSDDSKYVFEDETYCMKRGCLVMTSNTELHRTIAPMSGTYERYIVSFLPEYIENMGMEKEITNAFIHRPNSWYRCIQLSNQQLEELLASIRQLENYITIENCYGKELIKKLILAQILVLCNQYFASNDEEPLLWVTSEHLRSAFVYIREHIKENILLDDLSTSLFMSKRQMIRVFKKETGMTPNEYITMCRIMKSREYLIKGEPILKVCEMVGYSDESHFIRTFKKIMGITPKKYAKLKQ